MSAALSAATVRAATDVTTALRAAGNRLTDRMPLETAVAWVHSGALTQHAVAHGLVDDHGTLPATLDALARAHPALAGLVDPAVNRAFAGPVPDLGLVARLWRTHAVLDAPYRTDGYALGDLYQALSAEARAERALCQTPQFVSDLLWKLTVPDAMAAFGPDIRLIDPACGTGHILVEAAIRLAGTTAGGWPPGIDGALAAVHGVDLDPYAALIARYRLLALACRHNGRTWTAAQAPRDLPIQVTAADSLLDETEPLLQRGRYHVVLANPPYITVKDPDTRAAVRARYRQTCHGRYSLALPFTELMTELLVPGGFCAQLTANSFMKREFGRPFIENYLVNYDLTWVIDTSGAYIPGHGTPTLILAHRNQPPASDTVTVIHGRRGEPAVPADPARPADTCGPRSATPSISGCPPTASPPARPPGPHSSRPARRRPPHRAPRRPGRSTGSRRCWTCSPRRPPSRCARRRRPDDDRRTHGRGAARRAARRPPPAGHAPAGRRPGPGMVGAGRPAGPAGRPRPDHHQPLRRQGRALRAAAHHRPGRRRGRPRPNRRAVQPARRTRRLARHPRHGPARRPARRPVRRPARHRGPRPRPRARDRARPANSAASPAATTPATCAHAPSRNTGRWPTSSPPSTRSHPTPRPRRRCWWPSGSPVPARCAPARPRPRTRLRATRTRRRRPPAARRPSPQARPRAG